MRDHISLELYHLAFEARVFNQYCPGLRIAAHFMEMAQLHGQECYLGVASATPPVVYLTMVYLGSCQCHFISGVHDSKLAWAANLLD